VSDAGATRRASQLPIVAAAAVFGLSYGLSAPLIALALGRRGLGETLIGANAAMYALGVLAIATGLPGLAARFGARRVIVASLAAVAVLLPAFSFVPFVWLWFPLRFALGVASEGVLVLTEAWVNERSDESSRARSIAVYTAALSAGFALGPAILSATGSDGALPYWIGGALALIALAIVNASRAVPPRFADVERAGRSRRALLGLAPVALAATALNASLETAGLSFLPIYAMRLGWGESSATLLITTLMIGAIALQLPIGWLGDRFDRRMLVLGLAALSAAGALAWPFVLDRPWIAHPLLFLWGGAFVGVYTLMTTIVGSRFAGSELIGIYALMSVAWGLGALVGPPATGVAMELLQHGLPLFAASACAGFALYAWRSRSPY
jgi:MFS family permease